MEQVSSQPTAEISNLLRLLTTLEPQCGIFGVPPDTIDCHRVPDIDRSYSEEALWREFEIRKRSAEWHVGQYLMFWDRCQSAGGHNKNVNQLDEELFKSNGTRERWRLKVEHDKAICDLLKIQRILKILVADEERATGFKCVKKALAYSAVLPGAYLVAHSQFSKASTIAAAAAAVIAGYGIVSALHCGAYASLRVLVIDKCRQMVASLENRVRAGAVNQDDRELFEQAWFIRMKSFELD